MDWTIISIIVFFVGTLLGYFVCYFQMKNKGPSKIQAAENQQLQDELKQYKQDVEQHFSSSADLLNKMATDYSKIYQHMAASQQTLLPDSEPTIAPLFIENQETAEHEININEQKESPAVESTTAPLEPEQVPEPKPEPAAEKEQEPTPEQQPSDYVKGASGIINPPDKSQVKEN
ncbi:MAG: YhcB family protein [Gammaproteobacteria bacterium]|nr:YhcB family protein [Gammaproteobacteria bacterium]